MAHRVSDWEILEIEPGADEKAIKKAYKKLALQHHPDKGGDPEQFRRVAEAYCALSAATGTPRSDAAAFAGDRATADPYEIFARFFGPSLRPSPRLASHRRARAQAGRTTASPSRRPRRSRRTTTPPSSGAFLGASFFFSSPPPRRHPLINHVSPENLFTNQDPNATADASADGDDGLLRAAASLLGPARLFRPTSSVLFSFPLRRCFF